MEHDSDGDISFSWRPGIGSQSLGKYTRSNGAKM